MQCTTKKRTKKTEPFIIKMLWLITYFSESNNQVSEEIFLK